MNFIQEYRSAGIVQNKNLRVAKYLIPVVIVSILLNIPKFLETSVHYDEETGEVSSELVTGFLRIGRLNVNYTRIALRTMKQKTGRLINSSDSCKQIRDV